jgi:DNA polymerase-3 subunit delta'
LTSSPFLLLPTILSRCQNLAFSAISKEEIEEILVDHDYPEEQARILSLLVDGNLERALDLGWEDVQTLKARSWELYEAITAGRQPSLFLERFGSPAKSSQEEFQQTLEIFASFTRDILLLDFRGDTRFLLNPDYEAKLREASGAWPARRAAALLGEIDFVLTELPKNLNKSLLAAAFFSNVGELSHV